MKIKNSKCLVLNADYTPLTTIDWTKAIVWSLKHEENKSSGIEIIDFYKDDQKKKIYHLDSKFYY